MWKKIAFLLGSCISLSAVEEISEELAVKRIQGHLFIKDPFSAVKEAKQFLSLYPESYKLQMAYLEALCQKGEEVEAFDQFLSLFGKVQSIEEVGRPALEWLAWGVLNKGETSPLLVVRLYSLLGAAFTQDARAIPIVMKELDGSNALLRTLAVRISSQYGDAPLRKELLRLLKEEKIWSVKMEVIQAVGNLRMQEARPLLEEIIGSSKSMAEEKALSILSLAGMYDAISLEELSLLTKSNRAGLRHLACEIVSHLDFQEGLSLLKPLLVDSSPDVRIASMKAFGLLQLDPNEPKLLQKNLEDPHFEVSITAGWLATILGKEEGKTTLEKWLKQERLEPKRFSAAAICVLGTQGVELAKAGILEQTDVYTRVNLAIGLIGQRKEVSLASQVLFSALQGAQNELWMWETKSNPLFRTLSPSRVRHRDEMPRYPQMVDQLVKLDLLSVLGIVGHPKALEAVKEFLKKQDFGVTGSAASTLLQEGDESSLDIVRELLEDPDEKVRVQAALILAVLGGDSSAVHVLMEAYPKVDRDTKIHLLEAIGHIGDPASIPFLVDLLKEPFLGLRVVAAAALIQCLYH